MVEIGVPKGEMGLVRTPKYFVVSEGETPVCIKFSMEEVLKTHSPKDKLIYVDFFDEKGIGLGTGRLIDGRMT